MKVWVLLFSHIICGVLGAGIVFLLNRPLAVPLLKETFTAQKNIEEISQPTNTITTKGQRVVIKYDIPTQHYGLIQGVIEAPRSAFAYKHSVGIGVVMLNTSALARVAYSYRCLELSGYLGYDYYRNVPAYGFGIGARWGF
ncbi:MAG: hypothetical protein ACRCY4_02470 [Brevinema sp.]